MDGARFDARMRVRVELMLMIAGDRWHDYMQVEYRPSSTKCLYNYKEGGSADEANANDSILGTRTSANATVRGEPIGPPSV